MRIALPTYAADDACRAFTSESSVVPLRILAVSALWQGANDYAFVRAFRRAGHSVSVVSEESYIPRVWRTKSLRALRRLIAPLLVREFAGALITEAEHFQPDLLFVFKGTYVPAETLDRIRSMGAIAVNFYPDTGISAHSPYLERALPLYDWIFTTKTFGVGEMAAQLAIHNASFLPHAFDPETHAPFPIGATDFARYRCDASFIGAWSPKKQKVLEHVRRCLPGMTLRVWGPNWNSISGVLSPCIERRPVLGIEYAKAISASSINLALLFEGNSGASSGDLITARTFEIPAVGGFMLHERTSEATQYFEDGKECAFFADMDDLVAKLAYYLDRPAKRKAIAEAGRRRSLLSGYSVDARVASVIAKYTQILAERQNRP